MSSLGEFRIITKRLTSVWCLEFGKWFSTLLLLNKYWMMDISDLKPISQYKMGVILPWSKEGRKAPFPALPSPASGMRGKLLWKWTPKRHLLAQFYDIKNKGVGALAFSVNSNISNFILPVSHCYLRENWIQTTLFFWSFQSNSIIISKEKAAYRIIFFWNCSVENVTSDVQGIRWEVSEHHGQWEIGNRKKSADKHYLFFEWTIQRHCFLGSVFVNILHGCVVGCISLWSSIQLNTPLPYIGFPHFLISLLFPPPLFSWNLPKSINT